MTPVEAQLHDELMRAHLRWVELAKALLHLGPRCVAIEIARLHTEKERATLSARLAEVGLDALVDDPRLLAIIDNCCVEMGDTINREASRALIEMVRTQETVPGC